MFYYNYLLNTYDKVNILSSSIPLSSHKYLLNLGLIHSSSHPVIQSFIQINVIAIEVTDSLSHLNRRQSTGIVCDCFSPFFEI